MCPWHKLAVCSSLVCEIPREINGTFVTEPLNSHESTKASVHWLIRDFSGKWFLWRESTRIIKEFRRNMTEEIEVGNFSALWEIINSKELWQSRLDLVYVILIRYIGWWGSKGTFDVYVFIFPAFPMPSTCLKQMHAHNLLRFKHKTVEFRV